MDEVKIWAVDDASTVASLHSKSQVDTEALLEETLVKNPGLLMPGLTLVGRQTPTPGGPLDLLGVDEHGKLVVFELKRGTLSREAVAQVIDYASYLDAMELAELAEYISERSGEHGIEKIEDFQEWHSQDFGELGTLKPLRMFLVGLGTDDRTERMVRFLAENSGMDISLLTFHGFAYDGKTLLARQVEVEGAPDTVPRQSRRYLSMAERSERLKRSKEEFGVSELFDAVRDMFRENWRGPGEYIGPTALGFYLREHTQSGRRPRAYARINPDPGRVRVIFYGRTLRLCPDEFDQAKHAIQFDTWGEGTYAELAFPVDSAGWETHKERLYALTQAVYEAWESRDQAEDSA